MPFGNGLGNGLGSRLGKGLGKGVRTTERDWCGKQPSDLG